MSAPAGTCEWCGGSQFWTVIRGVVHVSCVSGCLPLPLEGLVPHPDGEVVSGNRREAEEEPLGRGWGTELRESGEASEASAVPLDDDLPF